MESTLNQEQTQAEHRQLPRMMARQHYATRRQATASTKEMMYTIWERLRVATAHQPQNLVPTGLA